MQSRWFAADAPTDLLDLRVYTSRLLGAEEGLVLWGGGNTSVKVTQPDYRGDRIDLLRVKGSGSDLKTIERRHFAGVRLDDIRRLRSRAAMTDDEMVAYLTHALVDPSDPRPSIETLLHGFLPQRFVDHTHADAIVALTNQPDGAAVVHRLFGRRAAIIPWRRPGFALSQAVAEAWDSDPSVEGVVLINHGLFTFDDDARTSYERMIALVTEAEAFLAEARRRSRAFAGTAPPAPTPERIAAAPLAIRGAFPEPVVIDREGSADMLAFLADPQAAIVTQRGPATPDHVLRTKGWPAFVALPTGADEESLAAAVRAAIAAFVDRYTAYVARYADPNTPRLDPYPRLVLVPGVGAFAVARRTQDARMARDIYRRTITVLRDATAVGEYHPVAERDLFDVEYWPLELYKLRLTPPAKPLEGQIALVTGAASGIGRAICPSSGLAADGAVADLDGEGAERAAAAIRRQVQRPRAALALPLDVTQEASVVAAMTALAAEYGGIDLCVSNAGVAVISPLEILPLSEWERSLAVNATGHFLVARQALRLLRRQGRGGSVVFVSSKNAFAPGAEFGAYSVAKATETQLAKVLALEAGADGIRVNMVNPDAVFRGSRLWSDEVRAGRAAAHGVQPDDLEAFYAQRNLLHTPVYPEDVANAVAFLVSDQAAKITGCTITVDGGIPAAFPR